MPDESSEWKPPGNTGTPVKTRESLPPNETSKPDENCESKPPSETKTPLYAAFLRDVEELSASLPDASQDEWVRFSAAQDAAFHLHRKWSRQDLNKIVSNFGVEDLALSLITETVISFMIRHETSPSLWRTALVVLFAFFGINLLLVLYDAMFGSRSKLRAQVKAVMRGLSDPRHTERIIDAHSVVRLEYMKAISTQTQDTETLKAQNRSLQIDFEQLSKTFDSVLESKKMLQAQTSALNVHIQQRADKLVDLSNKYNRLSHEVHGLRKFKASVDTTLRDQIRITVTLEEANALKQEALDAKAQVTKNLEAIAQQQESTTKAKDDAIAYAKQMNRDCEQLKNTMQETRRLECQRATQLRQLEWDSVKAFEEKLKKQEDEEKMKQRAGNHVGVMEGAELLRGEHNSYAPAFRYATSAPRLGENARPLRMLEERKKEQLALVYAGAVAVRKVGEGEK